MRKRSAAKSNKCVMIEQYMCQAHGPDCVYREKSRDTYWHCHYWDLRTNECNCGEARKAAQRAAKKGAKA